MKNFKLDPEVSKPTLSVGPQSRDIRWHSGVPLPVKGDYLVEVIVEGGGIHVLYVYWDGENPYVYNNLNIEDMHELKDILRWAYDGDDT